MDNTLFKPGEIPYTELEYLGLSQQMVDDLPENAFNAVLNGLPSPLLSLRTEKSSGQMKNWMGRFYLVREENSGLCRAVVMPKVSNIRFGELSSSLLDEEGRSRLLEGETVRAAAEDGDRIFQLDRMTNQIVTADAEAVDFNIAAIFQNTEGLQQLSGGFVEKDISEGKLRTVSDGKGTVTIGIDLLSPEGVLVVPGDTGKWEEKRRSGDARRFSFGNYGCWVKAGDGHLSYTKEDDYSMEMNTLWKESLNSRRHEAERERSQQNLA